MNYYQILEINQNASHSDIKNSYKRLVKKYHPDVNKNSDSDDKFKQIQEAYSILGDTNKRVNYDNQILFKRMFSSHNNIYDFNSFQKRKREDDFDFGEYHYSQGGETTKNKHKSDLKINISIKPEETITDTIKTIQYKQRVVCYSCKGISDICDVCNGEKFIKEDKKIKINISSNIIVGLTETRFEGYGNQGYDGKFGDLILFIKDLESSDKFKVMQSSDGSPYILTKQEIDFFDVILGGVINIETINGVVEYEIQPLDLLKDGGVLMLEKMGCEIYNKEFDDVRAIDHICDFTIIYPEVTEVFINKIQEVKDTIYE